jgi:hypothetical protein
MRESAIEEAWKERDTLKHEAAIAKELSRERQGSKAKLGALRLINTVALWTKSVIEAKDHIWLFEINISHSIERYWKLN